MFVAKRLLSESQQHMARYIIRGGLEGKRRLEVLARVMWPTTSRILEQAGLATGMTCVDVGCGGGGGALQIGTFISPPGRSLGAGIGANKNAKAGGGPDKLWLPEG